MNSNMRSLGVDIETVGAYVFDELHIKPEDVLELDFNGNRDTKQLLLRNGLDVDKYIHNFPDTFKGFQVTVSKLTHTRSRVIFKFVPIDIPDYQPVQRLWRSREWS